MILASTSPYKKTQLESLGLSFSCVSPNVDESEIQDTPNMSLQEKAEKLSLMKAMAVAKECANEVVIAGDQLAAFDGKVMTKPKTKEKNIENLLQMSGKTHYLYTANTILKPGQEALTHTEVAELKMKPLTKEEIIRYVEKDQAWDCAGGYKYECSGHQLFSQVSVNDIQSIQGMCLNFLKKNLL